MKKIMQFRYCPNHPSYNNPTNLTGELLASGDLFSTYGPVSSLGIQGPPGLKFHLNNGDNSIIIGSTGIYELDMNNANHIMSIRFPGLDDSRGIDSGDPSQKALFIDGRKLIIDIIYGGGA